MKPIAGCLYKKYVYTYCQYTLAINLNLTVALILFPEKLTKISLHVQEKQIKRSFLKELFL